MKAPADAPTGGPTEDVEDPPVDDFDDDEVLTGELLPAVPDAAETAHAAIEAAARAAIEQPALVGRDEFLVLAMQARMMAGSALVPKALRGKPADVFLVLLTGRDIGIPVTSALRKVYVVDGQPSLAPQLKLALVRRQGLGQVVPHPDGTDEWQGAVPVGPDGNTLGPPIIVTWADAAAAGLVQIECAPGAHTEKCRRGQGDSGVKVKCKANWYSYPRRMLWWRAAGYCVDDYFPEVGLGLYAPDELGSVTDADGRPIDPATVELPDGFDSAAGAQRATFDDIADPLDLLSLRLRIAALPDEQRDALREAWGKSDRLRGMSVDRLPQGQIAFVQSMVRGFEALASRAGWDPDAARAETEAAFLDLAGAAQQPQDSPQADPGPEVPPDAQDAAEGDEGPDPDEP